MAKINEQCIGCGTCVSLASELFEIDSNTFKAVVKNQPVTQEEKDLFKVVKSACPAGAIED